MTVLTAKVILILPISVAAMVDLNTLECARTEFLECLLLEKLPVNLVMMDVPVLMAFTTVLVVSVYVLMVKLREAFMKLKK